MRDIKIAAGDFFQLEDDLEIQMGKINNIQYNRAPGGKVTGIIVPEEFEVSLKMIGNKSALLFLKKAKGKENPVVEWNQYRITLKGVELGSNNNYQYILFIEKVILKKVELDVLNNQMISGDELEGPEGLLLRHDGHETSHHASVSSVESSPRAYCLFSVSKGSEKTQFKIPVPLKTSTSFTWKKWIFTFFKVDSEAGTAKNEKPIEFKISIKN